MHCQDILMSQKKPPRQFFPFHNLLYSNRKYFFLVVTVFEESVGSYIFYFKPPKAASLQNSIVAYE